MAKNKRSTLKDLNEFLKSSKQGNDDPVEGDYLNTKPYSLVEVEKIEETEENGDNPALSAQKVTEKIRDLARQNQENVRMTLFRIIQMTLDNNEESNSSDLMLVNTAIYLEHTEKMGEGLRELLHKKRKRAE